MLKRLRGSGYRADKILGNTDQKSLEKDFSEFLDKVFPAHKSFQNKDIKGVMREFRTEFVRYTYLTPDFTKADSRVWTILLDGGRDNVLLTLFRNSKTTDGGDHESFGSDYFELYDGAQFVKPIRMKINTHSFEVLIQELNKLGIVKKFGN